MGQQWPFPPGLPSACDHLSKASPCTGVCSRCLALVGPKLYLAAFFSSHSSVQMVILWGVSEEMLLHLEEVPSWQEVCYLWHLRARWRN